MSHATTLPPAADRRLTPGGVILAWRGITRQQIGATFLLGCVLFVYHLTLGTLSEHLAGLAVHFVLEQVKAFAMLLAFVVADRVTGKDPDRRGVYAIAVAAGAALGGAAIGALGPVTSALFFGTQTAPSVGFAFYIGLEQLMLGAAAVWVINDRRRANRARDRLHRAEVERIAAEKRAVESDLQAMQARVEPQFLFNTLARVRALYREDAERGARMLDELIAYLRAAMPRMRDSASTLGQEIELARAYLEIVRLRLGDRFEFEIECPAAIAAIRMPAMMLLPLVDHAVAASDGEARQALSIRAASDGERVTLVVAGRGGVLANAAASYVLEGIRERLATLYGTRASIALRSDRDAAAQAQVAIEIPVEAGAVTDAA